MIIRRRIRSCVRVLVPKIQMGWPSILSSLKSLLETGKELPPFWRGDYDKK